ncbi:MAG: hypothetical protein R3313_05560, partial [Candidatus Saccharimonadales bacterium]|nr:hypothetical protein [Candidatus Saccharimonadales bacterium]
DYPIPANDDSIKATKLMLGYFVQAIAAGKLKHKQTPPKKPAPVLKKAAAAPIIKSQPAKTKLKDEPTKVKAQPKKAAAKAEPEKVAKKPAKTAAPKKKKEEK